MWREVEDRSLYLKPFKKKLKKKKNYLQKKLEEINHFERTSLARKNEHESYDSEFLRHCSSARGHKNGP